MQLQTIIDALTDQISDIRIDNGYYTDIGLNVKSSYSFDIADDELPLVNIVEDPEGSDVPQICGDEWRHDCPVRLDVITANEVGYVRKCVYDILQSIKKDKSIGGNCIGIQIKNISFSFMEFEKTYSTATIDLILEYITEEWRI